MQISLNKDPENQKAVGGFRKYLAGKCCVHSELQPHDPGKINLCEGKTMSGGLCKTPQSVSEHKTQQLYWWGGKGVRRGTDLFSRT